MRQPLWTLAGLVERLWLNREWYVDAEVLWLQAVFILEILG